MLTALVGKQITELRWRNRLSASHVSQEAGIPVEELIAIECGRTDPDMLTLNELCCIFDITLEELFNMVETHRADKYSVEFDFSQPPEPRSREDFQAAQQWYANRKLRWIGRSVSGSWSRKSATHY